MRNACVIASLCAVPVSPPDHEEVLRGERELSYGSWFPVRVYTGPEAGTLVDLAMHDLEVYTTGMKRGRGKWTARIVTAPVNLEHAVYYLHDASVFLARIEVLL